MVTILPESETPAGWSARLGTLAAELRLSGRGLHTGRRVNVRVLPVGPEAQRQGIVFRRLHNGRVLGEVAVSPGAWRKQPLCSMLQSQDGLKVRTVEHLLASLLMCEIDAATVELDAEEVPILDGSAARWVQAIAACGRVELPGAKRFLKVVRPFQMRFSKACKYAILPAPQCHLTTRIRPEGFPVIKWLGTLTPRTFAAEVAPARSYGFAKLALPAIVAGYLTGRPILRGVLHAPLAVIMNRRVLGGSLFPNEFARHRALDLIGDFALAGAPLLARIQASRTSHSDNHCVIQALLEARDAWVWAEFSLRSKADETDGRLYTPGERQRQSVKTLGRRPAPLYSKEKSETLA